jgi:hypothetical protein
MKRRTLPWTTLPLLALALGAPACSDSDDGDTGGSTGNGNGGDNDPPSARPDPCRGIALPASQHYVAPDLCARAVAVQQGRLRQIAFAQNGDLIGVRSSGEILRYRDLDDDGMYQGADEIATIANTGGNGNNASFDASESYLYAGSPD